MTECQSCRKKKILQLGSCNHDLRNTMKGDIINIDVKKYDCVDVVMDLRNTLPYPDNSIDIIFSEHFIEHFSISELTKMAKDWHRVMRTGGELIAVVPDGGVVIKRIIEAKEMPHSNYTICIFGYDIEYQRHKFIWTENLMKIFFTNIGFKNIKIGHAQSESTIPLMSMRVYK